MRGGARRLQRLARMWIALGIILLVGWALLKLVWGVASMAVHVALVLGVIALAVHFGRKFFAGRSRPEVT